MLNLECAMERGFDFFIGVVLFVIGLFFVVVSFTILPVVGLVVAIPVMAGAFKFFSGLKGQSCYIS